MIPKPGNYYKCVPEPLHMYTYWLCLSSEKYNLVGLLVDIHTGEVKHYSELNIIEEVDYYYIFGDL